MVRWPWLGGLALATAALLGQTGGAHGATSPADDARILEVQVNQGSGGQNQVDPLTAGAPTVVRVLADASDGSVPVYILLHGYHVGDTANVELAGSPLTPVTPLAQITLTPSSTPTETQFSIPPGWTTGGPLVLTAELVPVHRYASNGAECLADVCPTDNTWTTKTLHFVDTGVIRLHEVSETGVTGASTRPYPSVANAVSDLQVNQPIASGNLEFARSGEVSLADLNGNVPRADIPFLQCFSPRQPDGCPDGPDADDDGEVDSVDPSFVSSQSLMFTGLARLDLLTAGERCNGSTLHVACFDDALGMARNLPSGRTLGSIGHNVEAHQQVAVSGTGGRGTVHEFSHSLNRGHINAGSGCESDEVGTPNGVDAGWPYDDNTTNSTGVDTRPNSDGVGGFRVVQSTDAAPVYEVMSYCHADTAPTPPATDWWVSDYGRNLATSFLASVPPLSPSVAQKGVEFRAVLDDSGNLLGRYLIPAVDVPFPDDPKLPQAVLTDGVSQVFTATLHYEGGMLVGFIPMRYDQVPEVRSLTIDGETRLLHTSFVPIVTTASAHASSTGLTVDWSAQDPDLSDPLIVAIDYATSAGAPWRTLWVGPNYQHSPVTLPTASLPGSASPYVRVRVGDHNGMQWGSKVVPAPARTVRPPSVYLGDPTLLMTTVNVGNPVTLTGSATDQLLHSLAGTQLRWKADGTTLSPTGGLVQARFTTPGPHAITLTATDLAGRSTSVTHGINVLATPPLPLGLSVSATATRAYVSFTPTHSGVLYAYGAGTVPVYRTVSAGPQVFTVLLTKRTGRIDLHLRLWSGTAATDLVVTVDRIPVDIP